MVISERACGAVGSGTRGPGGRKWGHSECSWEPYGATAQKGCLGLGVGKEGSCGLGPSWDLNGTCVLLCLPLTGLLGWPCPPDLCGRVALEVLGASNSFPISTSFTRLSPGRLHPRTLRGLPPPYTELSPFTVQSSWQGGHMGLSWPSGRTLIQPVILPRQQCTSLTLCQVRTRSEDVT